MLKKADIRSYFRKLDGSPNKFESYPLTRSFYLNKKDEVQEWIDLGVLEKAVNKEEGKRVQIIVESVVRSVLLKYSTIQEGEWYFQEIHNSLNYKNKYRFKFSFNESILEEEIDPVLWLNCMRSFEKFPWLLDGQSMSYSSAYKNKACIVFKKALKNLESIPADEKEVRQEYWDFLGQTSLLNHLYPSDSNLSVLREIASRGNVEYLKKVTDLFETRLDKHPLQKYSQREWSAVSQYSSASTHKYMEIEKECRDILNNQWKSLIINKKFFVSQYSGWNNFNWLFNEDSIFSISSPVSLWKEALLSFPLPETNGDSMPALSRSYQVGSFLRATLYPVADKIQHGSASNPKELEERVAHRLDSLKVFLNECQNSNVYQLIRMFDEFNYVWSSTFYDSRGLSLPNIFEQEYREKLWKPLLELCQPYNQDKNDLSDLLLNNAYEFMGRMFASGMQDVPSKELFDPHVFLSSMEEGELKFKEVITLHNIKSDNLGFLMMAYTAGVKVEDVKKKNEAYQIIGWIRRFGSTHEDKAKKTPIDTWMSGYVPNITGDRSQLFTLLEEFLEKKWMKSAENLMVKNEMVLSSKERIKAIKAYLNETNDSIRVPSSCLKTEMFGKFLKLIHKDPDHPEEEVRSWIMSLKILMSPFLKNGQREYSEWLEREYEDKKSNWSPTQQLFFLEELDLEVFSMKWKEAKDKAMGKHLDTTLIHGIQSPSPSLKDTRF